ncbi:MAG: hypothetical protein R3B13_20055 [Polyangiaceae bacterium]
MARERSLVAWSKSLQRVRKLANERQVAEYLQLVSQLTGKEPADWFQALVDSIVVREDHGVYEAVYTALWRFPPLRFGPAMVAALPGLIRRMNRHEQAERFLIGITSRPRHRKAFVTAFADAPAADQDVILRALRKWSQGSEDWNALSAALGAPPKAQPAPAKPVTASTTWPERWRKFHQQLVKGSAKHMDVWAWRDRKEAARFVAHLLSQPLGAKWREAEALTNPLFVSFAMAHFGAFIDELERLDLASRRVALDQIAKVKRAKRTKAMDAWPEYAERVGTIERMRAALRG